MRPQAWALSHGSGVQEGDKDKAVSKERFVFIAPFLSTCRCYWCRPLHRGLIYDSYPPGNKMFRADDLPINIKGLRLIMALVVITLPLP